MKDTIYVVHATVGVYSDRTEWLVAWYPTREDAEAHGALAQAEGARILAAISERELDYWSDEALALIRTELDPFRSLYCGDWPRYSVIALERGKWPYALPAEGTVSK